MRKIRRLTQGWGPARGGLLARQEKMKGAELVSHLWRAKCTMWFEEGDSKLDRAGTGRDGSRWIVDDRSIMVGVDYGGGLR